MYRKSSKGNPYHDKNGRFTFKNSDEAITWSSFGEQTDISKKTEEQKDKLDKKKTKSHLEDGERFYHKQSIAREKKARGFADITLKKGTNMKDRKKIMSKIVADFRKENKVALRNKSTRLVSNLCGNTIKLQIIESPRTAYRVHKNGTATINTSTSMRVFSGYTVAFKDDSEIRSCKKNATMEECIQHLDKYCQKHKKIMSQTNICLKVWRNNDRVFYMPCYHFDTKAEADAFVNKNKDRKTIMQNHDDGSKA